MKRCKLCNVEANQAHLNGRAHAAAVKAAEIEKRGYVLLGDAPNTTKEMLLVAETSSRSGFRRLGGWLQAGRMVKQIWVSKALNKLIQNRIDAAVFQALCELKQAQEAVPSTPITPSRAAWIAAGCRHPASAEILAEKQASGMTWTQFEGRE